MPIQNINLKLTDSAVEIAAAVCGQPRNDIQTSFLSLRGVPFLDDEAISNTNWLLSKN